MEPLDAGNHRKKLPFNAGVMRSASESAFEA